MQKVDSKPKRKSMPWEKGVRLDRKIHEIFKSNISAEPSEHLDSHRQRSDRCCDHWQECDLQHAVDAGRRVDSQECNTPAAKVNFHFTSKEGCHLNHSLYITQCPFSALLFKRSCQVGVWSSCSCFQFQELQSIIPTLSFQWPKKKNKSF